MSGGEEAPRESLTSSPCVVGAERPDVAFRVFAGIAATPIGFVFDGDEDFRLFRDGTPVVRVRIGSMEIIPTVPTPPTSRGDLHIPLPGVTACAKASWVASHSFA